MLVVAGFPFAAVGFERNAAEGVPPGVRLGEGAVPQVLRRREGQDQVALGAGRHVDGVPLQPVRGIGEAGAEPPGIVLGLADTFGMAETGPLGLQHGEDLFLVVQDVIAGQALAPPAASLNPAWADHLAPDAGAFDDAPAGCFQFRIDAIRAGLGLGLVVQAHGSVCVRSVRRRRRVAEGIGEGH